MHAGDLHARHAAHIHQTPLCQKLPRHTDVHDGRRRLAAQGQRMPGDQCRQFVQAEMQPAILMDPSVEETIRKAIRQTSAGAFLALDPDTSRRFIAAVGAAAGDYRKHVQMPVLLASMDIRRYVRRLIEAEHYRLPVVSYQELTPEISVQPMNRIRL